MPEKRVDVLIVAKLGRVQAGLLSLLTAKSKVGGLCLASDLDSMLDLLTRCRPGLVLCGPGWSVNELASFLQRAKDICPEARCLAFVDDADLAHDSGLANADAIAWTGFPAQQLSVLIDRLI